MFGGRTHACPARLIVEARECPLALQVLQPVLDVGRIVELAQREVQVVDAALAERIIAEVGTLSPLDQQIFRLCAEEGYAYGAAAEALGVSHGVVRNRLSRIRTRLRGTIAAEGT